MPSLDMMFPTVLALLLAEAEAAAAMRKDEKIHFCFTFIHFFTVFL